MSSGRGRRAGLAMLGKILAAAALPGRHGIAIAGEVIEDSTATLTEEAETALAGGSAEAALSLFERASLRVHSARAETGIVRALMQQGQYRRAVAFAAHVAGAHGDHPEGIALYAWLLWIGAQPVIARQVLARARQRAPADAVLAEADALLSSTATFAERFRSGAARLLPYSLQTPSLPLDAELAGSGCIVGQRLVLISVRADDRLDRVWVREGLGRVVAARLEARDDRLGVGTLRLLEPLFEEPAPLPATPRDAFPGSPAWSAAFPHFTGALPAWPLLRAGFLGVRANRSLQFGLDHEDAEFFTAGGVVFDAAGRWIGVAAGRSPARGMVQVSALREAGLLPSEVVAERSTAPLAADAIYELALARTVQILA